MVLEVNFSTKKKKNEYHLTQIKFKEVINAIHLKVSKMEIK
jgi:hypothetical protein